jgi:hypothetical protein
MKKKATNAPEATLLAIAMVVLVVAEAETKQMEKETAVGLLGLIKLIEEIRRVGLAVEAEAKGSGEKSVLI